MAGTMNFFRAQDEARGRTTKLVVLLVLAIVVLAGSFYVLAVLGQNKLSRRGELDWFQGDLFFWTTGVALIVIIGGSLVRIAELSKGGGAIAERLGGRLVGATTKDAAERRGSAWECLEMSRQAVTAHWGWAFLLLLVAGLLAYAGLIACIIGVFVTMPFYGLMMAAAYDRLFAEQAPPF